MENEHLRAPTLNRKFHSFFLNLHKIICPDFYMIWIFGIDYCNVY